MDAELSERVLECLRGCEIGESISADGIADEIGEKLSDVYDAIEGLEEARLVELHPAYRKGNDPTYTLTTRGKHLDRSEPDTSPSVPLTAEQHKMAAPPSADRVCRFCGKVMEPNKVRRHENLCGKNPDSVSNTARRKATRDEAVESNATATIEHEVDLDNDDLLATIEQIAADSPVDVPDEVRVDNTRAEQLISKALSGDALVLKGSPGMDAALRLIAFCQRMAGSGAQVSVDATVQVSEGFHIHVDLCVPTGEPDE